MRKYPVGAEIINGESVHFRVWAPGKNSVEIVFFEPSNTPGNSSFKLENKGKGYFEALVPAEPGTLYKFRLNGVNDFYPDPASRFQPYGPHGPSEIIDPAKFKWTDNNWKGIDVQGLVLYEMHVGTFTHDGNWKSAEEKLGYLAETGINAIEVMPVAEFPGTFGWGYDGVTFFAPTRIYGRPDDFRSFINKAHANGISVILDVVYNHLGPDGNYLGKYSDDYITSKYKTDWGAAINYDGENSKGVREFFISNARYWIEEYHLDGLRLDATQDIFDDSETHILAEIHDAVRQAGKGRKTFIVTENEPQNSILVRERKQGGYGFDAMWNDDFHHSAMVALTGKNEAYYTDYLGKPQEFISSLKYGFLYQGQFYKWQKKRRGKPALDLKPSNFINFIQNHDQIANSGKGLRVHQLTSPAKYRAMTALLLLAPQIPMLFQGQEFGSSSPFLYFADHNKEIAAAVKNGRKEFLSQFPSLASPEIIAILTDPASEKTFQRSKLDFSELEKNHEIYNMHKDLLRIRKEDPGIKSSIIDGAVLESSCFLIRYFAEEDRLLLINFGVDLNLNPAPEPLLAAPEKKQWHILWSSENPKYGGSGTGKLETPENWMIPGNAAVLLEVINMEENDG